MNLNDEEKKLLIRAFTCYYQEDVWNYSVRKFNEDGTVKSEEKEGVERSEEDYRIRHLTEKLGIRGMFPQEIQMRW